MRQSGVPPKYSAAEKVHVKMVRFSTLKRQELENWSVAQITETRLYDGNKPVRGSPNDLRLGVSTMEFKCETCGETRECQGHFGHIRLNFPVFHYGFMHYVEQVLKCVCFFCSKLRIASLPPKDKYKKERLAHALRITHPAKRLNELGKILGGVRECLSKTTEEDVHNGCGHRLPSRIWIKNHQIIMTFSEEKYDKKEVIYNSREVQRILKSIQTKDAEILGFTISKPIDLMITTLAVAPPQIRPTIEMNPEKHAEDDITSAYVRIVAANKQFVEEMPQAEKQAKIREMERTIASIMVKVEKLNVEQMPAGRRKRQSKAIKSIEERLKSKEGRFRQHLMGKRVDFSARSVVSPDSNLALDELGVPQKIAKWLTIPQQVTEWNYDRMLKLCLEGGAKYILKPSQDKRTYEDVVNLLKMGDKAGEIEKHLGYGMIVERCLQDGDYVLFNRQPTLHRMSMMGHRVRILPYNTFRLNLSVCTPYNADFDGDEMNMHVPQSYQTIAQIKHITHVPKQIVAPKNNAPVIGIVQDALLGIYLFTMRDTFLTREQVMNLVIWIEQRFASDHLQPGELPMPAILKPEVLWTGKQIMSLIIPDKISIEIAKSGDMYRNINDNSMIIRKGQIISGALQKEVVGSGAGGLVHSIWLQIGSDATNQFVTTAQRIINTWLTTNSFSIGAADIVPSEELQLSIEKESKEIVDHYYDKLNDYRSQKIIQAKTLHQRGKRIFDSFDYFINSTLNNRLETMANIITKNVSPYLNNIYKIITAKSKGNETNLLQIMFSLGNQNVDGKRLPLGFSRRSLPHFPKDDFSPQARGFVFSSFYKGLKPHQFYFHSMGGREGLSDTAVKTSRTGYIQRKLVKSLQDLVIRYDGTVRDAQNNLLQKLYGEDSFSAEYIQKQKLPDVTLPQDAFRHKYSWNKRTLEDRFRYDEVQVRKLQGEIQSLLRYRRRLIEIFILKKDTSDVEYYCPINIRRIVRKIQATENREKGLEVVNPLYVFEQVQKTLEECVIPQAAAEQRELNKELSLAETETKKNELNRRKRQFEQENGLELFRIHIRMYLASKLVCETYRLSQRFFHGLLQEIKMKFFQALAPAGEAIGSIAAQSVGEPTTQMTLNTFHLAGVADKNVTLGVPRLQQLLDASKSIRTPSSTIFLKEKILFANRSKPEVQKNLGALVSFHFPERHVGDFLAASRIYYDPNPDKSNIGAKTKELITQTKTPWVISLQFDPKKLTSKESWNELLHKIESENEKSFEIIQRIGFMESKEEPAELTLRCLQSWVDAQEQERERDPKRKKMLMEDYIFRRLNEEQMRIKNTFVSGIKNIKTVKIAGRVVLQSNTNEVMPETKNIASNNYVIFETDGSNLRACLSHPRIDEKKTYCNDTTEVYNVLGIEAARQSFINQFKQILKPYSIYINFRHLSILSDWMSTRGMLTAINRNGINRVKDVSVLRKASFEETTDVLFTAAAFSQMDPLKGISQRIIFGESVSIGTRCFEVMIDRATVQNYNAKGKKDREVEQEEREEVVNGIGSQRDGSRTPHPYDTPYGRASVRTARSPMVYGGASPAFQSPIYSYSHRGGEFSSRVGDERLADSPMPSFRQPMGTPLLVSTSPMYNSFHQQSLSNARSPYYPSYQPSNSPIYSSTVRSQSPNYESSAHNSSPQYTPTPHRQAPFKEDHDQDDEDQDDQ